MTLNLPRNLQRVFVILPGGAVRQGALFARNLQRRACRIHLQGFRRPIWIPEVDVFGSAVDARAESRAARGEVNP